MFEKFRPLNKNVWVKVIKEEDKTAGGLYIPDSAKKETQVGLIEAVGSESELKSGAKIFFRKFAGVKAGEKHLVLKEDDILGVIED